MMKYDITLLFSNQVIRLSTYVFETIHLLPYTRTYLHGSHYIQYITLLLSHTIITLLPKYTIRITSPIFLLAIAFSVL